jgi:hypothetical protein
MPFMVDWSCPHENYEDGMGTSCWGQDAGPLALGGPASRRHTH